MKKTYPLTDELSKKNLYTITLQKHFDRFLEVRWFQKKRTACEIAEYLEILSEAKADFWLNVYRKWPEASASNCSATMTELTLELPDEPAAKELDNSTPPA